MFSFMVPRVRDSRSRAPVVRRRPGAAPPHPRPHAPGRPGLALETADAVVVRDELAAVPAVVRLSRTARRPVRQNLVIAGTVITVLVLWDLLGHLPFPLGVAGHAWRSGQPQDS